MLTDTLSCFVGEPPIGNIHAKSCQLRSLLRANPDAGVSFDSPETRRRKNALSAGRALKFTALVIMALCHAMAYLQYQSIFPTLNLPLQLLMEFTILFVISCATGAAVIVMKNERLLIWLLLFQNLVCFLIAVPVGRVLSFKFTLLLMLVMEASLVLRFPKGLILSFTSTGVWLLGQREYSAWFQKIPAPAFVDLIIFGLSVMIVSVVGTLVRYFFERYQKELAAKQFLDGTILQLTSANVGFQQYASDAEERSTEEERRRVTREIHDTVGYALTNLNMMMEAAIDLADPANTRLVELLDGAKNQALAALNATRFSLRSLRSMETPRLEGLQRIQRLVKAFTEATRVSVSIEYGNAPWSFGETVDSVLYRIIQEAMTNAFRHGKATRISITMWLVDDDTIQLIVHDNGRGANSVVEGIGISGMRERIASLDGALELGNVVDGFQIVARIPLHKGDENVG